MYIKLCVCVHAPRVWCTCVCVLTQINFLCLLYLKWVHDTDTKFRSMTNKNFKGYPFYALHCFYNVLVSFSF